MQSDSVPEDVVFEAGLSDIVEILSHRKGSTGWEMKYVMEEWEENGKKKETIDWGQVENLFEDCQGPVDEGKESINLVVDYCKKARCPRSLQVIVAKLAGQELNNLFPTIVKNTEKGKQMKQPVQPTTIKCNHSSVVFDCHQYVEVDNSFYFKTGNKWNGLACRGCGTVFGTGEGQYKPTRNQSCYVCQYYQLDKTNCKEMFCVKCFQKKSLEGESKRSTCSKRKETA
jgi:hypothetical protein